MDVVQLVTLVAGILGIVWYLQRSIGSLRIEIKQDIAALRTELKAEIASVNERIDRTNDRIDGSNDRIDGTNDRIDRLHSAVSENGQRLARIEGYLGIGMPAEAAARAAGAGFATAG